MTNTPDEPLEDKDMMTTGPEDPGASTGGDADGTDGDSSDTTDGDDHGERHATLACRAEGSTGKVVDHLVKIGVGHDDAVVLGPAHRLHSLARRDAALVDVMGDVRRADEAHRSDVGMV